MLTTALNIEHIGLEDVCLNCGDKGCSHCEESTDPRLECEGDFEDEVDPSGGYEEDDDDWDDTTEDYCPSCGESFCVGQCDYDPSDNEDSPWLPQNDESMD